MTKVVYNADYGGFGLSNEAIEWLLKRGSKSIELYDPPLLGGGKGEWIGPRHDPLLVECVEALGSKANDTFANLEIAEIKGNLYRIDEYDGSEWVQTPNDIEWININGTG